MSNEIIFIKFKLNLTERIFRFFQNIYILEFLYTNYITEQKRKK